MFRRIGLVAAAVLLGDFAAGYLLPKLNLVDDPASNFDAADIVSALLIGVVYVTLHRMLA